MSQNQRVDQSGGRELPPITTSSSSFEALRRGGYLYVDKTELLYQMVRGYTGAWFAARPRRFGKSLTVSTLKAIFLGKRELFEGLFISSTDYDWVPAPVIHLDFGSCLTSSVGTVASWLSGMLLDTAACYGVELEAQHPAAMFERLIRQLYARGGERVVILIDEYDKPMSDHIDNLELLREMKALLHSFYQVLKGTDACLRFLFMTGVTEYARISIFSELNNLTDITLSPRYATLFGYTQSELEHFFSGHIQAALDEQGEVNRENWLENGAPFTHRTLLEALRQWYNGYRFHPDAETVYNPVSTGKFFAEERAFRNHWIDTGTPSMLIDTVKRQALAMLNLEEYQIEREAFSVFEIERLAQGLLTREEMLVLFFQTGYVTIDRAVRIGERHLWSLAYPDKEVKRAFFSRILSHSLQGETGAILTEVSAAVLAGDLPRFMAAVHGYYAAFGYDIQLQYEKYYQSLLYALLFLAGLDVETEKTTNIGRIDAVLATPENLYLFELKYNASAQAAIEQMKERGYAERYLPEARQKGQRVHLVGINFDGEKRNIGDWCEEIVV